MRSDRFFIGGRWVEPSTSATLDVLDPATGKPAGTVALGAAEDVDRAVAAARAAFPAFAATPVAERVALLERIVERYRARSQELADTIVAEVGSPPGFALAAQVGAGLGQFATAVETLRGFAFTERRGSTEVRLEPIGVCGLITPWNWPLLLIGAKLAPALAAGCTSVLKPSELAPGNALVLMDILAEAGVPDGVVNLVNGDGPGVGAAIAAHPGIDMVSFTGSTRAGVEVARAAAPTVKRVTQELGGKSANILLPDADLETAIPRDIGDVCANSGQSCNAGSRILVPRAQLARAEAIAKAAAEAVTVGLPQDEPRIGPLISQAAYDKVQRLLHSALAEGAQLVTGGPGRPEGLEEGFFVRPTVLTGVTNDMAIAREEIFGPVVTLIAYDTVDEAVEIANDTDYGLAGYISGADPEQVRAVAARLRTGMVHLNGAGLDFGAAFGGYKQSGNGREYADFGLHEYLEVKSVFGYN